jgi:flagellar motor switch protein FliM
MATRNASTGAGVITYDFKHPERITKDQVRTIRGLHEKFAQTFGTTLSTLLRTMVQVELTSVNQLTYAEYMTSLPNPSCLYILGFEQLKGNAILAVNPEFTLYTIDRLLGGPGDKFGDPRPITMIEQGVMRRIVDRALALLDETWKQVIPLNTRILHFEVNPLFVQIAPVTETVILLSFKVQNSKIESSMDFCFPYFVMEKLLPELSVQRWSVSPKEDRPHSPVMNRRLQRVDVPLTVVIDVQRLTVAELSHLQPGDIIRLDRHVQEELDVKIDHLTKYRCRPGRIGSRLAVEITSVVQPEEEMTYGE